MRIPPPESDGELVFGDGPHNPFLGALEALLGQVEAGQLLLIWVALAASQSLTTAYGQACCPSTRTTPARPSQASSPEMLQELSKDYDGVVGIDGAAPGHDVGVDEPLLVKKREHHLLGASRCHLGLNRAL
jgi:hypothetical protein